MGFTSVQAHIFVKKVDAEQLDSAFWKNYVRQMSSNCRGNIKGKIPSKFISDSEEDIKIKEKDNEDEQPVDISDFFGSADDLVHKHYIAALLEYGCPDAFEIPKHKIKKLMVKKIANDATIRFNNIEFDPNSVYFVIGVFGKAYPGSIGGGMRYDDPETIDNFNFLLNLKCLKKQGQYRHLRLISNELKPDSLYMCKNSMLECFELNSKC